MLNVYGALNQKRYIPDRRDDLNRSFSAPPKAPKPNALPLSFLKHCDYGIDLHTGAIHRSNLPQIRANLKDAETLALAEAFGVPVLLNSDLRDSSLRQSAVDLDTRILLYEAGEALRFDEVSIRGGLRGIVNVLNSLDMLKRKTKHKHAQPFIANNSSWMCANASGIVNSLKELGDQVTKGEALANIGNTFGDTLNTVTANKLGVIIGKQNIPLAQEGDAMYYIAYFAKEDETIAEHIEAMQKSLEDRDDPSITGEQI